MKKDYFEHPLPKLYELKELYKSPYRFSDELRKQVDYIFTHPYNKYNKLYNNLHKEYDSNDMLKSAYLNTKYYIDNPQQFAHSMDNIAEQILVSMWKSFIMLNKHLRANQYNIYHATDMKLLNLIKGRFYDILLEDMRTNNIIMSGDELVKKRKGKGLREQNRASLQEHSKHFEYLCSLD